MEYHFSTMNTRNKIRPVGGPLYFKDTIKTDQRGIRHH